MFSMSDDIDTLADTSRPGQRVGGRAGGKQLGSHNKTTIQRDLTLNEAMILATKQLSEMDIENLDPLEVIKIAMKIAVRAASWFKAADLANMIVSYVHPKLQAVSVTNVNDDNSKSNAALERELAEIDASSQAANKARVAAAPVQNGLPELGDQSTVPVWIPAREASRPSVQ